MASPETAKLRADLKKTRAILAKVMERQAVAVAIFFEEERNNVCNQMSADQFARDAKLVGGHYLNPFDTAIEEFRVSEMQLKRAKEMVREYVKRESDLYDNAEKSGE